jgi:hypothetical protein
MIGTGQMKGDDPEEGAKGEKSDARALISPPFTGVDSASKEGSERIYTSMWI